MLPPQEEDYMTRNFLAAAIFINSSPVRPQPRRPQPTRALSKLTAGVDIPSVLFLPRYPGRTPIRSSPYFRMVTSASRCAERRWREERQRELRRLEQPSHRCGGPEGAHGQLHYEEDFYATFTLGFGGATSARVSLTAYTSPNQGFGTVKEVLFKVSQGASLRPMGWWRSS